MELPVRKLRWKEGGIVRTLGMKLNHLPLWSFFVQLLSVLASAGLQATVPGLSTSCYSFMVDIHSSFPNGLQHKEI